MNISHIIIPFFGFVVVIGLVVFVLFATVVYNLNTTPAIYTGKKPESSKEIATNHDE